MGMIELDDLDDDIKCISWYKGKENMLSIGTDKALYIYFEELNCIWQFLCKMELEGINEITWK